MRPKRPDEFYEQIADLYRHNGMQGSNAFVGGLYGVPLTTAARWIKEARRRGILEDFTSRECTACGRPHTAESLRFDQDRRARWSRGA
jgi:hypothetical protein